MALSRVPTSAVPAPPIALVTYTGLPHSESWLVAGDLPGRRDGPLRAAVRAEKRPPAHVVIAGVLPEANELPVGGVQHKKLRFDKRRAAHAVRGLEQLGGLVVRRAARVNRH